MQVDHALLSHEDVAEAVAFASPDELMGEVVSAVVVLRKGMLVDSSDHDLAADIRSFLASRLSREKVCSLLLTMRMDCKI